VLLSVIGSLIGIVAIALALLYLGQDRLLYPAPPSRVPEVLPPDTSMLTLESGYALLQSAPADGHDEPRPLLIFTHGNGETAQMWLGAFGPLLARGISVLVVEYPGYGGAPGRPTRKTIEKTMLAAYDAAVKLPGVDPSRIVGYGRSIGGGAMGLLAGRRPLAALCLESSFTTLHELLAEKGLPVFLLRDRYDTAEVLAQLDIPVFLYHGRHDTLIPFHHSERLAGLATEATLLPADCGHNDCPRPWGPLLSFLEEKVGLPGAD